MLLCSGGALKNLLSKIKGQRDEWVQRSASSTETDPSVRSSDQESTGWYVTSRVRTCSRNLRMFSNFTCLFEYPRMFSNLTQCSRMFSKRIVFKMQLFWPYVGINRVRHYTFLTVRQHPVSTRTRPCDPNSCRTNARQPSATCDAPFGRRSGTEA